MVNNEYQKLLERQANICTLQFMKYNNKKDVILQNFNKCVKLFNINEEPNDTGTNTQQEQNEAGNEGVRQNNEGNNE